MGGGYEGIECGRGLRGKEGGENEGEPMEGGGVVVMIVAATTKAMSNNAFGSNMMTPRRHFPKNINPTVFRTPRGF